MHKTEITRRQALAFTTLSLAGLPALAQQDFPNKPLRMVVPYAPGGGTDTIGRLLATKLGENWKATVVVENKPGAGGVIGNDMVAKAPADGYTILMGITVMVQHPALMPKLPYELLKDFQPLAVAARSADLFMVHRDVPANTLEEFVKLAKADPRTYALGSYGNGTSGHIHSAMLNSQAGLDLSIAHYKGAGPLMADLMGGQIRAAFIDATTAAAQVSGGRVKVLGVTGARRSPLAPNVPTFTELGYKSFEPYGWFALFTQGATPPAITKKLSDELNAILAQPEVRKRLEELGLLPGGEPQAEFAREMRRDLDIWGKVIREANIKIDQ
ncbi:Bug family tripartite tricarboxylate transporter substrate binding protein [Pseudorhodoferax sp.]|uniref:Bug family tripartite tricarboxylate transporter substrate binding protein n=1 Tax=Pseudorhodoferax sp. TaxID=1993553 RepID=UPI002DD65A8E|nr:tripartite tricarboxylate transporter substrate binding protein [Pseudorhodoferax sp.]